MPTQHWKSLDERDAADGYGERAAAEFAEVGAEPTRRDFLKLAGFTMAGAAASCARAPVRPAIPYVSQPDGLIAGRPLHYATTCGGCTAGCGLVVKTRDGRPIKIEGSSEHPIARGGVCAVGQSTLLGLYDNLRYRKPQLGGRPAAWTDVDAFVARKIDAIRTNKSAVRLLTSTVHSPTMRRQIDTFLSMFADAAHVEYDAISVSAILDAHAATHGARMLPRYLFDRADVVVSFDADFLGTWVSPGEFTAAYARRRNPEAHTASAWHAQIESRVSITGGRADRRIAKAPDEIAELLYDVAQIVEQGGGGRDLPSELAARLLQARGRALVVCGLQDVQAQVLCNRLNQTLGSYGSTIDLARRSYQRRGDDRAVERLLGEAADGRIAALFVWHANPLFDLPRADALARIPLIVSFAERPDETAAVAHAICPDHHALESWLDAEPVAGLIGVSQPLVRPLGETRAFIETLAVWARQPRAARDIVRETWRDTILPRQHGEFDLERFWSQAVQAGFVEVDPVGTTEPADGCVGAVVQPFRAVVPPVAAARARCRPKGLDYATRAASTQPHSWVSTTPASAEPIQRPHVFGAATHLVLYHKTAIMGGEHAWNPLLQELPDPVTKIVWDNYASIAPALASQLTVAEGDVVRVEAGDASIELPVHVQPGQHERTVAIALGYGSVVTERFKDLGHHWFQSRPTVGPNGRVGTSVVPLLAYRDGLQQRHVANVRVAGTGRVHDLACTQDHHTLTVPAHLAPRGGERRPIVQEVAWGQTVAQAHEGHPAADLWPDDHSAKGYRWGMAVDLNACTGCGACVIACQVENNIPVVGKDEVRRNRELHWLRVDRYYSEDDDGLHIAQQPMFCQHCGHAPCETVCPVVATVHSAEGLNQQVYNRCVGTRYCANNCPYKARRFNWFAYPAPTGTELLMLNPDVTVRSRGVMEKCTMCVQRIQEGKIEAKRLGRRVEDGEIQTACQQSCSARAIVFGDLNDPKSAVSRAAHGQRAYAVLEELNVKPSVSYLKIVRQTSGTTSGEGRQHG